MFKIYKGAIELVGSTPLVEMTNIEKKEQLKARFLVKLEYFDPTGSVRDRVGKTMTEDAERTGWLELDSVITEPISSNTGIDLTAISTVKGHRMILTMPDIISVECRNILKTYGAGTVLTPGEKGMSDAIEKAEELVKEIPGNFILDQFDNPVNPRAHMESTGPEIWQDTGGQVDIFVASVGIEGTLTGTGTHLKEENPRIKVIAVEPSTPAVLSEENAGPHKIQGIGAGSIPEALDTRVYDEIITVDNETPFATAKMLARAKGLPIGVSLGVVLYVGTEIVRRPKNEGKTIITLLPDSEDQYYSMILFVE